MAIYRGSGGAGDATGGATVSLVTSLTLRAEDAEAAAAASETNAAASETAAAASESAAAASESAAAASESAAAASESAAAASEAAAAISETNAAASAVTAQTYSNDANIFKNLTITLKDQVVLLEADAEASAAAAATSETNAATSETNAANSASAASTSATNAASSASAASTSATNAASSASAASTSATAAANSASAASTSATNASNSASAALVSETNASVSSLNAASSETNAAISEGNAATSELNASVSENNAASSATAAATSASAASAAQTAAEAAQAAAEAAQEAIDGSYLGAQTSDPSLDLNGDPVTAGDWYYNTTTNVTRIYDGSVWVNGAVSTASFLLAGNNLSDLSSASTARTNLGLGTSDSPSFNTVTLSGGTANGVPYLNGSKVLTSGSALTFDGTNFGVGAVASYGGAYGTIHAFAAGGATLRLDRTGAGTSTIQSVETGVAYRDLTFDAANNIFSISGSERARIDSSGNLLVGSTSGFGARIHAVTSSSAGCIATSATASSGTRYHLVFYENSTERGSVTSNGAAVVYNSVSDYRLKENVAPIAGALAKVAQLNPVTYTWKGSGSSGQGFIAHELQAVVPECVTGEKDAVDANGKPKYQGIDTSFLVATLTAAIQEQQAIIEDLKTRLTAAGL